MTWLKAVGVARIEISFCSTSEVTHVDSIFWMLNAKNISKCKWEPRESWMHSRAMNIIEIRIIFNFHTRRPRAALFVAFNWNVVLILAASLSFLLRFLRRHAIDEFCSFSQARAYMLMTFEWIASYVGRHGPTITRVRAAIAATTTAAQSCETLAASVDPSLFNTEKVGLLMRHRCLVHRKKHVGTARVFA